MTSIFQRRFAATAILAALSLPVLAQQAPVAPPAASAQAQPRDGGHNRHNPHERRHGDMAQHHAKRLADLKGQLKLTAAQESAWTSFTTAMQPGERPARLDHNGMEKLTTPERIDRMRAMRAQHAAEADRRGEATKTFYATLTPDQQKTFDAQAHRGPRMGGMQGHMKGGEGHRHGSGDKGEHRGMHRGEGKPGTAAMPAPTAPAPAQ